MKRFPTTDDIRAVAGSCLGFMIVTQVSWFWMTGSEALAKQGQWLGMIVGFIIGVYLVAMEKTDEASLPRDGLRPEERPPAP